jgi:phosphoribosylaminoimidazolecarboxamide formyltransferase/IMP cyclohydrolase
MVYPPNTLLSKIRIKRAIFSCYDKTRLIDLAKSLASSGQVELIASGGTATKLRDANLLVTSVEQITGFPEMPGGLVKTLHPKIHGGLLAEVNPIHLMEGKSDEATINKDQVQYLKEQSISLIDLVVCNLYPFAEAVKNKGTIEDCRTQIDIGGPTLIRSAAKNFPRVAVLTNPKQYEDFLTLVKAQEWCTTFEQRFLLAEQAFQTISKYDNDI